MVPEKSREKSTRIYLLSNHPTREFMPDSDTLYVATAAKEPGTLLCNYLAGCLKYVFRPATVFCQRGWVWSSIQARYVETCTSENQMSMKWTP